MTHTFKLARRMARFRALALAALFAAACGDGDDFSTAPSALPPADPGTDSSIPTGSDSSVSIDAEPPAPEPVAPPPTGIPFGPFDAWDDATLKTGTQIFTASLGSVNPGNIVERLAAARAVGVKLILAMTGGKHERYMRRGVFDLAKWQRAMQAYNAPEIKAAVAAAVADGTIIGNIVMDEPHVHGAGDGNTWGPSGTMTKARVDELCAYVKRQHPTLPVGVAHNWHVFEPEKSYASCEFLISQYASRLGSVTAYRDGALAMGRRDGMAILFSINLLNGGTQDEDGVWDCAGTGGKGTYPPNCRMTAQQVRDHGRVLGPAGCGFLMWRYDEDFMAKPDNLQAFEDVRTALASASSTSCRRA